MVYDYKDTSQVPELDIFKIELVEELLKSSFFQLYLQKTHKMLKLPIIAPPSVIGKQINSDSLKETIMEKPFVYKEETLAEFQALVDSKHLKLGDISGLTNDELKSISKKIGNHSN